jgi:hypothetical protein
MCPLLEVDRPCHRAAGTRQSDPALETFVVRSDRGVGKFVKSLNVLSWEEACELNPNLNSGAAQVAAE